MSIDSSIAIVAQTSNNSTSDLSSDHSDDQVDVMATITATLNRLTAITEGGKKIIQILRSAIAEVNNANASNKPTDYSRLIDMLRGDIIVPSLVTTESILYDGATMRLMKTALNNSGHTDYQLPEQSNLEALIDELYSVTPNIHNDIMSLYRARMADLYRPTTTYNSNHSEQQCPTSPQRVPSSSNHRHSIYSDNPNCPPSLTFTFSASHQVSFCNDTVDIPMNERSGSQDVQARVNQPIAPVIGSTALFEPPLSQTNSFLNRSQSRNSFLLNNSNKCNLNLTPDTADRITAQLRAATSWG
jgi:hypothetical protein